MKRAVEMAVVIAAAIVLANLVAPASASTWEWHWAHTHCLDIFWWLR